MSDEVIETGAQALQVLGELARQNALLVYYRNARKQWALSNGDFRRLDNLELEALVMQQRLLKVLDEVLPALIAEGADRYPVQDRKRVSA